MVHGSEKETVDLLKMELENPKPPVAEIVPLIQMLSRIGETSSLATLETYEANIYSGLVPDGEKKRLLLSAIRSSKHAISQRLGRIVCE